MQVWEWIPISEAAESLHLSNRWIRRCIDAGIVSAITVDSTEFVWLNDVVIRARRVGML